MNNKKILMISSVGFVGILFVLAFGKIDYNISNKLINSNSTWANFFNMFGEIPAYLGLAVATIILYGGRKHRSVVKNLLFGTISYILLLMFSLIISYMPIRYLFEFDDSGIPTIYRYLIFAIALILFTVSVVLIKKVDQKTFEKFKRSAIVIITLVVIEVLFVNVLKIIWARPRMRSIENFESFRYWWQINGPLNSEEFKSFPSGHTANAFVMLVLLSFVDKNKSNLRRNVAIFAFTWGILTAISRVVIGAHFLSDVVFSGYITVVLYFVFDSLINRKVV